MTGESLFQWVFPSMTTVFWKITVILIAAWVLHFCLWRCNPRWRVLLWRFTFCSVLFIPIISMMVPVYDVSVPKIALMPSHYTSIPLTMVSNQMPSDIIPNGSELQASTIHQTQNSQENADRISNAVAQSVTPFQRSWKTILLTGWGIVTFILLLRLIPSYRWLSRIQRDSTPAPVPLKEHLKRVSMDFNYIRYIDLRISSQLGTPILCGIKTPIIILPDYMLRDDYEEELPAVLAHEITHLQSKDMWWMTAIQLMQVLLWFHPLIWKMRSAHDAACESVCDRIAAEYVGNEQTYSETLARVALDLFAKPPEYGAISMAKLSNIHKRLHFLKQKIRATPFTKRAVVFTSVFATICLVAVAGLNPQQDVSDSEIKDETSAIAKPINTDSGSIDFQTSITIRQQTEEDTDWYIGNDMTKDGKLKVYVDWETGNLVLHDTITGKKRNLTNEGSWDESGAFAEDCIFSLDEKEVIYTWSEYNGNEDQWYSLRAIQLDGSNERTIISKEENIIGLGRLKNKEKIFARITKNDEYNFSLIDLNKNTIETIKHFDKSSYSSSNSPWGLTSPNGEYLLYQYRSPETNEITVSVYSIENKIDIPVVQQNASNRAVGWSPDGKWVFFISNRYGGNTLIGVPFNETGQYREPNVIYEFPKELKPVWIKTNNGKQLFFHERLTYNDPYFAEFNLEKGIILDTPQNIGLNVKAMIKGGGPWSYDGTKIALDYKKDEKSCVVIYDTKDGSNREIHANFYHVAPQQWKRNGHEILCVVQKTNTSDSDSYILDIETGTFTQIQIGNLLKTSGFSEDEKEIYYFTTPNESGIQHIAVYNLESKESRILYSGKLSLSFFPTWPKNRSDRSQLVLFDSNSSSIKHINLISGSEKTLHTHKDTNSQVHFLHFLKDQPYIIFTTVEQRVGRNGRTTFWKLPLEGGEPEKLSSFPYEMRYFFKEPNGNRIAYTVINRKYNSWVMENFVPQEVAQTQ